MDSLIDLWSPSCERRENMSDAAAVESKRVRLSQADVPSMELEKTLRLARAIWDNFAGRGARPLHLAEALDIKPSSGGWRELCGASIAYNLTDGGYNAQEIRLTELGRRIVAPREEGDDAIAIVESSLSPRVCKDFITKYDGAKFPSDRVAASVLVDLGVPKERTERALLEFFARIVSSPAYSDPLKERHIWHSELLLPPCTGKRLKGSLELKQPKNNRHRRQPLCSR